MLIRKDVLLSIVKMKNIVALAHLHDPRTAKMAAKRVATYSDNQATAVLYTLCAAEPFGMTYDQLEELLEMRSAKQRLSDLKRAGLVTGTGETKETRWGSPAEIYRPTSSVFVEAFGEMQTALL